MTDKEQIIIDGEKYNECNGCKLWDGYICTGDRSYEPNAEAHRAICNEHIAKEFWKVYRELFHKTQECNTLKNQLDFAVQQKECFEQLCEALKSEGFTRESLITEQENEIDELRQECEELKKQLTQAMYLSEGTLRLYSDRKNIKYKQALEEIEEIVKQTCRKRCTNDCLGTKKHCGYGAIFNIINKAKEENEQRE